MGVINFTGTDLTMNEDFYIGLIEIMGKCAEAHTDNCDLGFEISGARIGVHMEFTIEAENE